MSEEKKVNESYVRLKVGELEVIISDSRECGESTKSLNTIALQDIKNLLDIVKINKITGII